MLSISHRRLRRAAYPLVAALEFVCFTLSRDPNVVKGHASYVTLHFPSNLPEVMLRVSKSQMSTRVVECTEEICEYFTPLERHLIPRPTYSLPPVSIQRWTTTTLPISVWKRVASCERRIQIQVRLHIVCSRVFTRFLPNPIPTLRLSLRVPDPNHADGMSY
jgi:hypothetical protein